jgi:RHH-type rel operon transcriptional repressor/antitoxin RelB
MCVTMCTLETLMSTSTTVTVRIPAALRNRLNKLAEATARTRSWLAAHALEVYVEDQEWHINTIREGKKAARSGRVASHKNVSRWLRSWGRRRELPPPACE